MHAESRRFRSQLPATRWASHASSLVTPDTGVSKSQICACQVETCRHSSVRHRVSARENVRSAQLVKHRVKHDKHASAHPQNQPLSRSNRSHTAETRAFQAPQTSPPAASNSPDSADRHDAVIQFHCTAVLAPSFRSPRASTSLGAPERGQAIPPVFRLRISFLTSGPRASGCVSISQRYARSQRYACERIRMRTLLDMLVERYVDTGLA